MGNGVGADRGRCRCEPITTPRPGKGVSTADRRSRRRSELRFWIAGFFPVPADASPRGARLTAVATGTGNPAVLQFEKMRRPAPTLLPVPPIHNRSHFTKESTIIFAPQATPRSRAKTLRDSPRGIKIPVSLIFSSSMADHRDPFWKS